MLATFPKGCAENGGPENAGPNNLAVDAAADV